MLNNYKSTQYPQYATLTNHLYEFYPDIFEDLYSSMNTLEFWTPALLSYILKNKDVYEQCQRAFRTTRSYFNQFCRNQVQ